MNRLFAATSIALALSLAICQAQEPLTPASHAILSHGHASAPCDNGQCGTCATCATCSDCVRVNEIKKTQHPVYSCTVKEKCIPNCGLLCGLFGGGDCKKIEVRQLVKRYRTDEECVSTCMTQADAAKHYEAEAKKAAGAAPAAK